VPVHAHTRHRYRARNAQTTPPPPSPDVLAAREQLGHFGRYVCGKTPAAHHEQWFPHLVPGTDSEELSRIAGENLNILAPRGSAKSTWLAIFCAWALGHNPGAQIIYVGYSESVALKQSRIVKRIIESAKYQRVFPHIRPGARWSDRDWEIDKAHAGVNSLDSDYSFYAVGITCAITSRRASLIAQVPVAQPMGQALLPSMFRTAMSGAQVPGGMPGPGQAVSGMLPILYKNILLFPSNNIPKRVVNSLDASLCLVFGPGSVAYGSGGKGVTLKRHNDTDYDRHMRYIWSHWCDMVYQLDDSVNSGAAVELRSFGAV
jgi:hypothetical protein